MSYRPSVSRPSGPWGPTLDRVRRERDWSQQQAFEALREGLRLGPKSRAAYVSLEAGRVPSPEQHAYLVSQFGEPEPVAAATTEGDLAGSIRELAEAIRQERAERIEWERGVLESLQALAQALVQRDDPEPAPRAGVRH